MNRYLSAGIAICVMALGCEGVAKFGSDASLDVTVDSHGDGMADSGPTDTVDPDVPDGDAGDVPVDCVDDSDCDDGEPCNGLESCSLAGECAPGVSMIDGTACDLGGGLGTCIGGVCVGVDCGDGVKSASEECDDGNDVEGDGCDSDCRYSCHTDGECADGIVCTDDSCSLGGTGFMCRNPFGDGPCEDGNPCTAPDHCGEGGVCVPGPATPLWYPDNDHDGFGIPGAPICSNYPPPGTADNDDDCCDGNSDVNPGQTAYFVDEHVCISATVLGFDYDCDGLEEHQTDAMGDCMYDAASGECVTVEGWGWDIPDCGESSEWITLCDWFFGFCEVSDWEDRIQSCH